MLQCTLIKTTIRCLHRWPRRAVRRRARASSKNQSRRLEPATAGQHRPFKQHALLHIQKAHSESSPRPLAFRSHPSLPSTCWMVCGNACRAGQCGVSALTSTHLCILYLTSDSIFVTDTSLPSTVSSSRSYGHLKFCSQTHLLRPAVHILLYMRVGRGQYSALK